MCVGVLWGLAIVVYAQEAIMLSEKTALIEGGRYLAFLEDTANNLSLEEVLAADQAGRFEVNQMATFVRPPSTSAFWFRLRVANQAEEDAWMEIGTTFAWYIDFYAPDTAGQYSQVIRTGTMRPYESRPYDVNLFWLPLNKAGDTTTKVYYFKVKEELAAELPLLVGTIRSLSKNKDINDYLTAAFVGLVVIMVLYNGFIFLSTRESIYLIYVAYIFTMMLGMTYSNGYPFIQDFPIIHKDTWNTYFYMWHSCVYFLIGFFCIRYLNLGPRRVPFAYWLIWVLMLIPSVPFPILNYFGVPIAVLTPPFQLAILSLYFTCLMTGYYLVLFKKDTQARFYVLGWTFMIGFVFAYFAVMNGILELNAFTRNTLYYGFSLELWMFSLALGDRLNIARREKEKIQAENIQLIENQKTMLEEKVTARTLELQQANQAISAQKEELITQAEELAAVNATKDKLFAIIGHDLRSPIASLKGLLSLVSAQNLSQEEFREVVPKLSSGVEHLFFTLNNLLAWANNQMQGMASKVEPVSLHELAQENCNLLHAAAANKQITLQNLLPKEAIGKADRQQLNVVFRNLISNALKFTPAGGNIMVCASVEGGYWQVCVKDSGIGMSDMQLDRLFRKTATFTTQGTAGEKGTGLGLLLCQEMVEQNGGKIWAESEEGAGAKFYFTVQKAA